LLICLFAEMGLEIDLTELRSACIALHFHVLLQSFSLLVLPFLYWVAIHRWSLAENSGLLTARFASGTMATMCLPTTTNTGVMFTQQAGGDVSASVINAAVGNFIGALVAPLVASLTLNGEVAQQDTGSVVRSLVEQIILPLVCGVVVQTCIRATVTIATDTDARMRACLRKTSSVILVVILYFIFCNAFARSAGTVSGKSLSLLVAYLTVLHLIIALLGWLVGSVFTVNRRISFLLMGAQKTESMGVAIITIIFAEDGAHLAEFTLPIVVYHTVQLLLGASIVGYLKGMSDKLQCATSPKNTDCNSPDGSQGLVSSAMPLSA